MTLIDSYCDICFDTYITELEKVSKPIIHRIENQIALNYITGSPIKAVHIPKYKITAMCMAMMSFQMIVDGRY